MSCEEQPTIDTGFWVKSDTLSPLRLQLTQRDENNVKQPYIIPGGATVALELRSRDTAGSLTVGCTVVNATLGYVSATNLAASWTAPTGKIDERFLGYIKVTSGTDLAWMKEILAVTLRTAP